MQKYKVKDGCRLEHDSQKYASGAVLELSPELALFHAPNIEVVKDIVKSQAKVQATKEDVSGGS